MATGRGPVRQRRTPVPVWWIAGAVVVLLVLVAPRYGWHRDELYFLEAGRHLAWGYVDQPPFTPFVARIAHEIAPGNLVVLRLLPAVAIGGVVVLAAAFVGELGGDRRTRVLGAAAAAGGGFALGVGHLLSTATFDLLAWVALLVVAARLLRTDDGRWWCAYGAVAGVALLNKNLVVLLTVALLAALAVERRWTLLATAWVPAGGVIAAVIAAPNLVWQATNGWPQFEMAQALSERLGAENRVTLLPLQLVLVGPLLVPLLWWGARWLFRDAAARAFRPLLWAWPVGLVLTLASGGRPYYVFPLGLAVALAGTVAHATRADGRSRTAVVPWLIGANAVLSIPLALPVLPLSSTRIATTVNETVAETVGWPELIDQVAAVVRRLPPAEREGVVLLTASYGEAGAIDRFGPARGLPAAFSAHNSYADFRRPTDDDAVVVGIRYDADRLAPHFDRCGRAATIENRHGVDNEARGTPILVCRDLRGTWADVWPRLRHLS